LAISKKKLQITFFKSNVTLVLLANVCMSLAKGNYKKIGETIKKRL